MSEMEAVFRRFYRENLWGAESVSGPGSTAWPTAVIRQRLPELLRELGVATLLDAPCGDFNWLSTCELPARYIGCDIVGELIDDVRRRHGSADRRFERLDITRDPLPAADLILCRDFLGHLPFSDIAATLTNFRASGARYLLATTFPRWRYNADIGACGDWRPLNLELPPFDLPPPLRLIAEVNVEDPRHTDKSLGLWQLAPAARPMASRPRSRRSIWVAGFPSDYGGPERRIESLVNDHGAEVRAHEARTLTIIRPSWTSTT
jgi:hypothetical protein